MTELEELAKKRHKQAYELMMHFKENSDVIGSALFMKYVEITKGISDIINKKVGAIVHAMEDFK